MPINFQDFPESVTSAYYLANSPSYLYKVLRSNSYIKMLAERDSEELITTFREKMNEPISTMADMARMYGLLIALTYKSLDEVQAFFNEVRNIRYEWFKDIADMFLDNYSPLPIFSTINVPQNQNVTSQIILPDSFSFSN